MSQEVDTENEKKGKVYEAFVKIAVEHACKISLGWEVDIPRVIANQDFSFPERGAPSLVLAVTHWGSHEAANKKFWRTVEDRFEVYDSYPKAKFVSVLFEMPKDSDEALDELLRIVCNGRALSRVNSAAIIALQTYVDSDDKVKSFGRGKDAVLTTVVDMYDSNVAFRNAIANLGSELKGLINGSHKKYNFIQPLLKRVRSNSARRKEDAYISSFKNTYYKAGLIGTLFFDPTAMCNVFSALRAHNWRCVSPSLLRQLVSMKMVKISGIRRKVVPSKELISLSQMSDKEYLKVRNQFCSCVDDPTSSLHFCKDHFLDLVDSNRRGKLLKYLQEAKTLEELLAVETGIDGVVTQRVWIIDYFCAIKRNFVHAKEYGIRKLSNELGFEYTGGGVSSPIPVYAQGNLERISLKEKRRLFAHILQEKEKFDWSKVNGAMIAVDRMTTMKKKFDVIELLISNALAKSGIGAVTPKFSVKNPVTASWVNAVAGITIYNFRLDGRNRAVLLFVVSSYDATHKHKELSGRVRLADVSGSLDGIPHKNIVVLDGTVFDSEPESKLKMLSKAGWDAVYYVDELGTMAQTVAQYLNGNSDSIKPRPDGQGSRSNAEVVVGALSCGKLGQDCDAGLPLAAYQRDAKKNKGRNYPSHKSR